MFETVIGIFVPSFGFKTKRGVVFCPPACVLHVNSQKLHDAFGIDY